MCAALIESERALVCERSAAGRAAAQDRGQVGGRKPKLDEDERSQAIALYQDSPQSVADICHKFDISRQTLYRYVDAIVLPGTRRSERATAGDCPAQLP